MDGNGDFRTSRSPSGGDDQRRDHPPADDAQKSPDRLTKGSKHTMTIGKLRRLQKQSSLALFHELSRSFEPETRSHFSKSA